VKLNTSDLYSAARIKPDDPTRYYVILPRDTSHKTLRLDDVVVMREYGTDNVFVRLQDGTIHELLDNSGHYVLLTPVVADAEQCRGS
jgi:hypothetical protein